MKDNIKELTEGMQRLCAIANRIVNNPGEVSLIEKDLLLEDLRRLYDVALRLREEEGDKNAVAPRNMPLQEATSNEPEEVSVEPDEEMLSSTVMATMAAMGVAEKEEMKKEPDPEPEPVAVPVSEPKSEPKPEPVAAPESPAITMPKMEDLEPVENSLLFDEVIIEPEIPSEQSTTMPSEEKEQEAGQKPMPSYLEPDLEPAMDDEPTTTAKKTPVEEAEVIEEVKPEPAEMSKAGTQASLLDYLKRPVEEKPTVRTLGDTLGEEIRSSEFGVQNREKVSDLRTVININDKFSFMSELFHNNMKAYNDFILRLNSIDTRDEALLCVNEVSAQYKWDENSLAVQSFYKVFDKKF